MKRFVIGIGLIGLCIITMLFINHEPQLSKLSDYVPVAAFADVQILESKTSRFAAFPEYLWRLRFESFDEAVLTRSGFGIQDEHELVYLRKVFAESLPSGHTADPDDRVFGKESEHVDVQILVNRNKKQALIFVLRH